MQNMKERRTRHDRRNLDQGPPTGRLDRRRGAERRLPEVSEHEFSDAEFSMYFSQRTAVQGNEAAAASGSNPGSRGDSDTVADIFGRVRD